MKRHIDIAKRESSTPPAKEARVPVTATPKQEKTPASPPPMPPEAPTKPTAKPESGTSFWSLAIVILAILIMSGFVYYLYLLSR